jgi:hypothetical protein
MNKNQKIEQLRKSVRKVIQEELTVKRTITIPVANLPLFKTGEQPTVINPITGEEEIVSDISSWATSNEELTTGTPSGEKKTGIVTIPLMDKNGNVVGYVKRKGTGKDIVMVGRFGPSTKGKVDEEENNFLPEPPDQLDDIPSVTLHIDDEGMMKIEVSALFHDQGNGKVPLLINNPVLQELVMKAIQVETQKAFRKAVHGVLGVPYGLPESSTVPDESNESLIVRLRNTPTYKNLLLGSTE